jgi:acyl-coenzyme A synthetase/AMP-(fatty) acid ligase
VHVRRQPGPLRRPAVLWELAARHRVTVFGTSPQYLLGMAKFGIDPSVHDLSSVRVVGCTGSTLPASAYPWVRDHVGERILLASISGGTDIVSGFAGSAPTTPVRAGPANCPLPTSAWRWPPTTPRATRWWTSSVSWSSPARCRPCRCSSSSPTG